jgi:hypothetical protein
MQRLLKVALCTVLAFLGAVLTFAGAHFWSVTHGTVLTVLDQASQSGNSDGEGSLQNDVVGAPWFDWGFIIQRVAAVIVLALGISIFCWAISLVRKKEHDCAT